MRGRGAGLFVPGPLRPKAFQVIILNVRSLQKGDFVAPRTSAQNQALRDATRTKILSAALGVFAEYGYAGASIRRIAEEAGVALGLLYSHFDGKGDLLRALFARSMDDVRESFAAAEGGQVQAQAPGGKAQVPASASASASAPGGQPPLALLIRGAFAILRRNLPFWKLSYGVRMQGAVLRELGPDLEAWTAEIRSVLEALFRAAGSPRPQIEAAILFAAIDGISQHYALDPAHYPLDAVAEALIAKYTDPPKRKAGSHGSPNSTRGPRRTRPK
jgi:AcrR family transcriptional regulator